MKNRYAWTLLIGLLPIGVSAQKLLVQDGKLNGILPVNEQGKVVYRSVQSIEGISQDQLLERARNWMIVTFTDPKDVLPVINATTGHVSGRGNFVVNPTQLGILVPTRISYRLVIDIEEGKYQVTLSGFSLKVKKTTRPIETIVSASVFVKETYVQTDEQSRALLWSLIKAMSSPIANF